MRDADWYQERDEKRAKDRRASDERRRAATPGRPLPTVAEILAFEAQHPKHTAGKEAAIRAEFDLSPARFYVLVNRAIRTEEALVVDPQTTHRILAHLAARAEARSTSTFTTTRKA